MFRELKNSIKKLLSDEIFVGAIIFMVITFFLILALFLAVDSYDDNHLKARCDSLEGKYGKGKCFQKGEEI